MKKLGLIFILFLGFQQFSTAQNEKFKALFIYNFAKHLQWPEDRCGGTFVVGVMGDTEVLDELQEFVVRRLQHFNYMSSIGFSALDELEYCQILYIAPDKTHLLRKIAEKFKGQAMLIVTDERKLRKGAAINFVMQGDELIYEISRKAIKKAKIKVSTDLIELGIAID